MFMQGAIEERDGKYRVALHYKWFIFRWKEYILKCSMPSMFDVFYEPKEYNNYDEAHKDLQKFIKKNSKKKTRWQEVNG
jgi:hypothetical protein